MAGAQLSAKTVRLSRCRARYTTECGDGVVSTRSAMIRYAAAISSGPNARKGPMYPCRRNASISSDVSREAGSFVKARSAG